MRRPSRLAVGLAAAYLIPAALLDVAVVRTLGQSYGYFDAIALAAVSAPVGAVAVGVGERFLPMAPDAAAAWFGLLVAAQAGNVALAWLAARGVKRVVRAVGRALWGGDPPAAGQADRMGGVRQ